MKTKIFLTLSICFFFVSALRAEYDPIVILLEEMENEIEDLNINFQNERIKYDARLFEVVKKIKTSKNKDILLQSLIEKIKLEEELKLLGNEFRIKLAERRYKKGIELIRLLYEKILGLDYHFSAIQTNKSLLQLANPASYPEFAKLNREIKKSLGKKRLGLNIPDALQANPFFVSSFSLVGTLLGEGSRRDKEKKLDEVSCIIDFTLRMSTDLKIIYFETEYLKTSNQTLKKDCMDLFVEYTKIIGYKVPLDKCRDSDDWGNVFLMLDAYIEEMRKLYDGSPKEVRLAYKKNSSLEFPLNLMTSFINKYNNFIGQGKNYYQKFWMILENYNNKDFCSESLPLKFKNLGAEIEEAVVEFEEAYNIAELKGSRLKDLLYGYDD